MRERRISSAFEREADVSILPSATVTCSCKRRNTHILFCTHSESLVSEGGRFRRDKILIVSRETLLRMVVLPWGEHGFCGCSLCDCLSSRSLAVSGSQSNRAGGEFGDFSFRPSEPETHRFSCPSAHAAFKA